MFLQHLKFVIAVITMTVTLARASEESELYEALKEAMLSKENLYALQDFLYPSDSLLTPDLNIIIEYKNITIKEKGNSSCLAFSFDLDCECYKRADETVVVKTSGDTNVLQSYILFFMETLRLADITFFKLLSSLTNNANAYFNFPRTVQLNFYVENLTTNPKEIIYRKVLQSLLKWVRYHLLNESYICYFNYHK